MAYAFDSFTNGEGFTNFRAALQGGASRIEILHALRYSVEGRQATVAIRRLLPRYVWEGSVAGSIE